MLSWEKMQDVREKFTDKFIVDELTQYMSSDDLDDFCEHLYSIID